MNFKIIYPWVPMLLVATFVYGCASTTVEATTQISLDEATRNVTNSSNVYEVARQSKYYINAVRQNGEFAITKVGTVKAQSLIDPTSIPQDSQIKVSIREMKDWYVGALYVPDLGYFGEVWVPVTKMQDNTGIEFFYKDYDSPVSAPSWENTISAMAFTKTQPMLKETFWAYIDGGNRTLRLIPNGSEYVAVESIRKKVYQMTFEQLNKKTADTTPFRLSFNGKQVWLVEQK